MTPVWLLTKAAGGLPIKAFLAGLDTTVQKKPLWNSVFLNLILERNTVVWDWTVQSASCNCTSVIRLLITRCDLRYKTDFSIHLTKTCLTL